MTTLTTWVFVEYVNQFTADEDDMYNLLTRDVMNEKVIKYILGRDDIGQQMFEGFVAERLTEGNLSVWDPIIVPGFLPGSSFSTQLLQSRR